MTFSPRALQLAVVCGVCATASGLAGQRAPARDPASAVSVVGTASITGRVVTDEAPERPIRRATLRLGGADMRTSQTAITNDAGEFTFAALPAGRYLITATRPGFIPMSFGAKRAEGPGSAISLVDGQHVSGVRLALLRGAVITGTVRDERGNPSGSQDIIVMRYRFDATGRRTLMRTGLGAQQTDDRGVYRIWGLPPGEYLVAATPSPSFRNTSAHQMTDADVQWALRAARNTGRGAGESIAPPPSGPNVVFAPVFYPGVPSEGSAARIVLRAGEERSGIDIPLQLVPAANIEGRVATADGEVPPNVRLSLLAHERLTALPFSGFTASSAAPDGSFRFQGVTPGVYTIAARVSDGPGRGVSTAATPQPSLYGLAEVSMDGRDQSVAVTLRPGVIVSGHVAFDGPSPRPPDPTRLNLDLVPVVDANGVAIGGPAAAIDATGAFRFTGVAPGQYRLRASMPGASASSPWQPRSAAIGGHDIFDTPLEVSADDVGGVSVTFSDRPAELSGTIQDAAGRPTPEYFVIVFARDRTYWTPQSRRIQAKRPASDGRFTFSNTPPGDYLLAAVTDVEQGEWYVPAFLTELAQAAIPLSIGEHEKKVQDVRVGR
jgi:protocatechuate 3,4-dioxygenase beta subunit